MTELPADSLCIISCEKRHASVYSCTVFDMTATPSSIPRDYQQTSDCGTYLSDNVFFRVWRRRNQVPLPGAPSQPGRRREAEDGHEQAGGFPLHASALRRTALVFCRTCVSYMPLPGLLSSPPLLLSTRRKRGRRRERNTMPRGESAPSSLTYRCDGDSIWFILRWTTRGRHRSLPHAARLSRDLQLKRRNARGA